MPTRILSIDRRGAGGLFPATDFQRLGNNLGQKITNLFEVNIGSATAASLPMDQIQNIYT